MFWPRGKHLAYNSTDLPNLSIIFPNFFHSASNTIWTTPSFNCKYPFNACAHIPSTPWVSISYITIITTSAQEPMMEFMTPLLTLCEMMASTWDENNYIHFLQPCLTPFVNNQHCVHQRWHLYPRQCCYCQPNTKGFTSPILHNSRICFIRCGSSKKKELS